MTAGAAVLLLGMQHEIKTELIGHGPVEAGVLKGALRVRGEGDPTFGARDHGESLAKLTFFAERLLGQGITRIGGDLLVDDSAFDQEFTGPEWPTSDARTTPYLAQVAALSLDDGCVRVMVTPGAVGQLRPSVSLVPDVGHVKLTNGITTSAGKEGGLRFDRAEGSNEISATGTIARGSADSAPRDRDPRPRDALRPRAAPGPEGGRHHRRRQPCGAPLPKSARAAKSSCATERRSRASFPRC